MRILTADDAGLAVAAGHLRDGGIVGIPTETVYGLAACARDAGAIAKVFEAKRRPTFDPLIVHVPQGDPLPVLDGIAALRSWSRRAEAHLAALSELWPGPLTLVLPRHPSIPDLAAAGLPTVAVRMPSHPVAQRLLAAVGPLVAPSANRFGRVSPTTAEAVRAELGEVVPFVLDGGPCAVGIESTVVLLEADGTVRLLRPGAIPLSELVDRVGVVTPAPPNAIVAPGQTSSHYAPERPLSMLRRPVETLPLAVLRPLLGSRVAFLRVAGPLGASIRVLESAGIEIVDARSLSETGRLDEAARGLFAALRAFDRPDVDQVLVELPQTEEGLGAAIIDRIRRAGSGRAPLDGGEAVGNAIAPSEGT